MKLGPTPELHQPPKNQDPVPPERPMLDIHPNSLEQKLQSTKILQ